MKIEIENNLTVTLTLSPEALNVLALAAYELATNATLTTQGHEWYVANLEALNDLRIFGLSREQEGFPQIGLEHLFAETEYEVREQQDEEFDAADYEPEPKTFFEDKNGRIVFNQGE